MSSSTLQERVEALAEAFVLADLVDSDSRNQVIDALAAVADHADAHAKVVQCAHAARTELSEQLDADSSRLAHAITLLDGCIRVMQEIVRDGRDPDKVALPDAVLNPPPLADVTTATVNVQDLLADFGLPAEASADADDLENQELVDHLRAVRGAFDTCAPDNLRQLARLHDAFLLLNQHPELERSQHKVASQAGNAVEAMVLGDSDNPAADLQVVGQLIDVLWKELMGEALPPTTEPTIAAPAQGAEGSAHVDDPLLAEEEFYAIADATAGPRPAAAPPIEPEPEDDEPATTSAASLVDELDALMPMPDAAEPPEAPAAASAGIQIQLPSAVDEAMLADFLGRQQGGLEEFEAILLNADDDPEGTADQVKRFLHTIKGECGLLGLDAVQSLCHQVEDVLGKAPLAELLEALLEVKDWLGTYFAACSGHAAPPPPAETLAICRIAQPPCPKPAKRVLPDPIEELEFGDTNNLFAAADESLLQDFVGESMEHLEAADQHLLELEDDPANRDRLDAIFRAFHTIKGVSSFLGLTEIQTLSHQAENLLDEMRKGALAANSTVLETIFRAVDALKTMISTGRYPPGGEALRELMRLLRRVRESKGLAATTTQPLPPPAPTARGSEGSSDGSLVKVRESLKVDAERLDRLIDIIGELVIAEAMISQSLAGIAGLTDHKRNQSQVAKITRELQEIGMSLRMVPVRPTFQKMARIVHDIARKQQKKVRFVMTGEETELDKTVVDRIGDPLLHMVRNAVDHGIEDSPADRVAAGKPEEATIELKAYHQGGNIYIAITDDGRGLDKAAIEAKAIRNGIIPEDHNLSDRDLYMLIFRAGFSTRQVATDVSGRGVGMDVVKRNIESLRGRVEVTTTKGAGSTFTLKLPLTLAIIEGMVVRVGEERYAIPTMSIIRTVSLAGAQISTALNKKEMLGDGDRTIPMFRLSQLFHIDEDADTGNRLAVLVETEGKRAAIVVDELLGQEQIVLKSLGQAMRGIPGLAGGAIMPDGRVGLIVDVVSLLSLAHEQKSEAISRRQPLQPAAGQKIA